MKAFASNEAGASVSNLPWPWTSADVGAVNWDGTANWTNAQFTVSGSGRGIPDPLVANLDSYQFVYLYVTNTSSGSIQARVASVQNTSANAKAGVMIRQNTDADSAFAMVDVQPTAGLEFATRTANGGSATASTATGSAPRWVRLTRTNNTFRAYASTDGNSWSALGSTVTFSSMASGAYVGLVVCSRDNGQTNTSVFDNVSSSFFPANTAPMLQPIANQAVNVGQAPPVTASATDADSPPPVLTFNLLAAPPSATLIKAGSTNAAFIWRPQVSDADTTNVVTLKVADNGSPSLSATQSFVVMVNPLRQPVLASPAWSNAQFSLLVTGQIGPDYAVQATTNLVNWSTLWTTNSPPMPFSWVDTNTSVFPFRFYRLLLGPPF